jgi:hypothetical protein
MDTGRFVQFDQDRLDAYELARVLARETEILLKRVSRRRGFYRMARRSATEAAAVLDNFVDRGVLLESDRISVPIRSVDSA